jgi:hypothetical protein
MKSKQSVTTEIASLAQQINALQQQAVVQYTPIVQQIIDSKTTDENHIERTLDYLLDFACTPSGLALYKKLCRYYHTINPQATAEYVNIYRELWDEKSLKQNKNENEKRK